MLIAIFLLSYLLGSIPFGFLIVYWVKGIDIRKFGSGNIGATNVLRVIGKGGGVCVFLLDFLKGFLPPLFAKSLLPNLSETAIIFTAILPVCGHIWTPFLKFKGGKGVAASLGAMSALSLIFPLVWICLLLALGVWVAVFLLLKYVSLASISSALAFFIFSLLFPLPKAVKVLSLFLFMIIILRHKKNIKDLLTKREHRF